MSGTVQFSCKCGKVSGRVADVTAKNSVRLACSCKHCRAFAAYLGDAERSFQNDYVQLMQTQPWMISFESGKEYLRNLRLTAKGPLRWYASCCDTPLCNTLPRRFPPFVSILVANFARQDDLPPVTFHAFCDHLPEDQRVAPSGSSAFRKFVLQFLWRVVQGLPFRFRQNPFFDEKGVAISDTVPLDPLRKSAAYQA
ncbi:DUF6151 family protein [Actibacterium pelagium]|nr:DUF6151 family protein [Actibacterium pelagium]